ncbi:MAG: YceI family protein [Pseudomonadota bacterium]
MIRLAALALALASLWAPTLSAAKEWRVDPARSEILFTYQRAGQDDQGKFHRFSGEGTFDPGAPESSVLELRIDSGSIDLNDRLASAFATSAEWFDSKNHPNVVYRLTGLTQTGPEAYTAAGDLTIRGETKPIEVPLALRFTGGVAEADGTLTIDRRAYLLGVGPSAAFVTIGPQVIVEFRLTATPN